MTEGLRPRKRLGQHFLSSPFHLRRIVDAAEIGSSDVVLEIGPGTGTLTRELVARAGRVIAVEIDMRLVTHLQRIFKDIPNLTIVHADILRLDPGRLVAKQVGASVSYKVVANLPYYITSAILRRLLESVLPPQILVVTVQKEVAQRMVASPPQMNLLAVSVQFYGQPRVVHHIPRSAFRPPPGVDSAVVRIDVYPHPAVEVPDKTQFFRLVRAGFGQKRKQLHNALASGLGLPPTDVKSLLERAGVDPRRRAETLTLLEWARLARVFEEAVQE